MRRKELFYYVKWGSNVTRDVHWCVTVFYQEIENSNIANQIHRFTIDYGKLILISVSDRLREVKNKRKFRTFSSKSGRGRLREMVAYKRFTM